MKPGHTSGLAGSFDPRSVSVVPVLPGLMRQAGEFAAAAAAGQRGMQAGTALLCPGEFGFKSCNSDLGQSRGHYFPLIKDGPRFVYCSCLHVSVLHLVHLHCRVDLTLCDALSSPEALCVSRRWLKTTFFAINGWDCGIVWSFSLASFKEYRYFIQTQSKLLHMCRGTAVVRFPIKDLRRKKKKERKRNNPLNLIFYMIVSGYMMLPFGQERYNHLVWRGKNISLTQIFSSLNYSEWDYFNPWLHVRWLSVLNHN